MCQNQEKNTNHITDYAMLILTKLGLRDKLIRRLIDWEVD
jgi:hypothetical protein